VTLTCAGAGFSGQGIRWEERPQGNPESLLYDLGHDAAPPDDSSVFEGIGTFLSPCGSWIDFRPKPGVYSSNLPREILVAPR